MSFLLLLQVRRTCSVQRSFEMYRINVDFPDPALPDIQKTPSPDFSHFLKFNRWVEALFSEKIYRNVLP